MKRTQYKILFKRLEEPRRFIQVLLGPRQTGKTTLAQQVIEDMDCPTTYASADEPVLKDRTWIEQQWEIARLKLDKDSTKAILVLDEIQKIPGWSETVKRLWDEDTYQRRNLYVIILDSPTLLVQSSLAESLAGRFEIIPITHWSFSEMQDCFGFTLNDYIFYGGYPGSAPLIQDFPRWRNYIVDALIETTISRDILLIQRVDKPALLRQLFYLGCQYSGQVLSFTKMLGQLQDAGNTVTLSNYLRLLEKAGLIKGLEKYYQQNFRKRASSPKLQVMNNALKTAISQVTLDELLKSRDLWGRLVESAIGTHLVNQSYSGDYSVNYWSERNYEVDFVLKKGDALIAIEVKSGCKKSSLAGVTTFANRFPVRRKILIGGDGIPIEEFLKMPVTSLFA